MQDSSLGKPIAASPQATPPTAPAWKSSVGPTWRMLWETQRLYWRQTLAVFAFTLLVVGGRGNSVTQNTLDRAAEIAPAAALARDNDVIAK